MDILSFQIAKKALKRAGYVGNKDTDLVGLLDRDIIQYDQQADKFIVKRNTAKVQQWQPNKQYEDGQMFVFDDMLWWALTDFTSNNGTTPEIDELNGLCIPFAKDLGYPNLINLAYELTNNNTQMNITWLNPNNEIFEGREVYLSNSIDITEMRYNEIQEQVTLGTVQKIADGEGTGIALADGVNNIPVELRKSYYVKGFAKYYDATISDFVFSSGRYFKLDNPDIYPPAQITDLNKEVVDANTIKLTFTQPSDTDLFKMKLVRSTSIITQPTDGEVIAIFNKNDLTEYTDLVEQNIKYYYAIFAYDDAGNGMEHGIEGNYSISNLLEVEVILSYITSINHTISEKGTIVTFNWTNPNDELFVGRELYYSNTTDITNLTYEQVQLAENTTMIDSGIGTGISQADTFVLNPANVREQFYVAMFTKHNGISIPTNPAILQFGNPDIYPPNPISNLIYDTTLTSVSFNFTQPIDNDFFYTRIVRNTTQFPTDPNDGTVVATISATGEQAYSENIEQNQDYFYTFFTFDDAGNGYETGVAGNWATNEQSKVRINIQPLFTFNLNTMSREDGAEGKVQADFDNIYPWNEMRRAVVDSSGQVVYYLNEDNSNFQEDGITPAVLDGSVGDVVVEIPSYYFRYENGRYTISGLEFPNSTLIPRELVGAFEGYKNISNVGLSIPNVQPTTGLSLPEFRLLMTNKASGWQITDVSFLTRLKALFAIEYGGLNSQLLIGTGIVDKLDEQPTGGTLALGNKSGVGSGGAVSYRGIENIWGNTWEIIEGFVATDIGYFTAISGFDSFVNETNFGTYVNNNIIPITSDGFISEFENEANFIGKLTNGTSSGDIGDYQFSHKNDQINIGVHGGNYQDGDKAGLFRLHMGVKMYGQIDEMELIDEFRDYTGGSVEIEYNRSGVFEQELNEGRIYTIKLAKQLNADEVNSFISLEVK